jgi:hypothetical protein
MNDMRAAAELKAVASPVAPDPARAQPRSPAAIRASSAPRMEEPPRAIDEILEIDPVRDNISSQLCHDMDVFGAEFIVESGLGILGRLTDCSVISTAGTVYVHEKARMRLRDRRRTSILHGVRVIIAGEVEADVIRADDLFVALPGARIRTRELVYQHMVLRGGARLEVNGRVAALGLADPKADEVRCARLAESRSAPPAV